MKNWIIRTNVKFDKWPVTLKLGIMIVWLVATEFGDKYLTITELPVILVGTGLIFIGWRLLARRYVKQLREQKEEIIS